MAMIHDYVPYALIASVGPAAAAIAQQPDAILEGATTSILGAVGFAVWRVANIAATALKDMKDHREAHAKQWQDWAEHRAAERAHWQAVANLGKTP